MEITIKFETGRSSIETYPEGQITVCCNEVAQIQGPDGISITMESVEGGLFINTGSNKVKVGGVGLYIGPIATRL